MSYVFASGKRVILTGKTINLALIRHFERRGYKVTTVIK